MPIGVIPEPTVGDVGHFMSAPAHDEDTRFWHLE